MKPSRKMLMPGDVSVGIKGGLKMVLTFTNGRRHSNDTIHTRLAVKTANKIGEVIQNGQIVLYGDHVAVRMEKISDRLGSA